MTENKRFTLTKGFGEHERQIRDNGKIIMGCFHEVQAKPIVVLLNELNDENEQLKQREQTLLNEIQDFQELLTTREETFLKPIYTALDDAIQNERTALGKSALKQFKEQIME